MCEEPQFAVIDVSQWEITGEETAGAEAKFWLEEPGTQRRWLFKTVTVKDQHVHGEDWAEKAASHLARLLGIPGAEVEMAVRGTTKGAISLSLKPRPYQMQPGRVLLETRAAPGYVHRSGGMIHPGHSPDNIRAALEGVLPPPGCNVPFASTAYDIFAGYVLFDAWIANQDRHDHNWSVLSPATSEAGPMRLSGSYDHASSLAFNEQDGRRETLLARPGGVEKWCTRGRANRFEGRPLLVDAAAIALDRASCDARNYWLEQLEHIRDGQVEAILSRVPRMSDAARTFAVRVLEINRGRILDACM